MNAIQIKNVTKKYKDVTALDNVSFSFEYGKIYGFLGRNIVAQLSRQKSKIFIMN